MKKRTSKEGVIIDIERGYTLLVLFFIFLSLSPYLPPNHLSVRIIGIVAVSEESDLAVVQ